MQVDNKLVKLPNSQLRYASRCHFRLPYSGRRKQSIEMLPAHTEAARRFSFVPGRFPHCDFCSYRQRPVVPPLNHLAQRGDEFGRQVGQSYQVSWTHVDCDVLA